MGKQSRARMLATIRRWRSARNIRVSPRKLNLVAQQIRGKKVDHALNVLTFSQKRIARDGQEDPAVGDRQCREQSRSGRR